MIMPIQMTVELVPRTKKNSQQIVKTNGRTLIVPSKTYREYERAAGWYIKGKGIEIDYPVNVKAIYYMPNRRRVDLVNLHEALCDILVKYGVVKDDNSKIIASMDGSRVEYDKDRPRTEIWITRKE